MICQAIKVHEEFFLPGEVIIEQGNVVDQLYIVCHGKLVRFSSTNSMLSSVMFLKECIPYIISIFYQVV